MAGEVADRMYFVVSGDMLYTYDEKVAGKMRAQFGGELSDATKLRGSASQQSLTEVARKAAALVSNQESDDSEPDMHTSATSTSEKDRQSFFTVQGNELNPGPKRGKLIVKGQWFCEPILWVRWKHVGMLAASTHTELYGLNSQAFIDHSRNSHPDFQEVCVYARYWLKKVWESGVPVTDVSCDLEMLHSITHDAFDYVAGYEESVMCSLMHNHTSSEDSGTDEDSWRGDYSAPSTLYRGNGNLNGLGVVPSYRRNSSS